ncbi:MAG: nitroreductase family protein [Spirochaetaceae bacterium]
MNVHEAIALRKSVRSWEKKPVEEEKLRRVLESARLAPSAKNRQEWRFLVVTDPEKRSALSDAAGGQEFVGEAPVVLVACAETDRREMHCGHLAFLVDVSIAIDHLTLAAVEEGLGTCWIGHFDPERVREILSIPREVEVVELIPLGYPKNPERIGKSRLPMEQIVYRERWGEK